MSADHWGDCPKCKHIHNQYMEGLRRRVSEAYGKVTADEYMNLLEELNNPKLPPALTLREDYNIGTDIDGFFGVNYSCHCDVCGFKFSFKQGEGIGFVDQSGD